MMASGILLTVVVAVTSAITAGQQHAFEARQRIAAGIAAQELMGRLLTEPYASLDGWDGYVEPVGTALDGAGRPMPEMFGAIGREVDVVEQLETIVPVDVRVRGAELRVRAVDGSGRVLAEVIQFVPEPQA